MIYVWFKCIIKTCLRAKGVRLRKGKDRETLRGAVVPVLQQTHEKTKDQWAARAFRSKISCEHWGGTCVYASRNVGVCIALRICYDIFGECERYRSKKVTGQESYGVT